MEVLLSELFAATTSIAIGSALVDFVVDIERTPPQTISKIIAHVCIPENKRKRVYLLGREGGSDPVVAMPLWTHFGSTEMSSAIMLMRIKRIVVAPHAFSTGSSRALTANVAGHWRHANNNVIEGTMKGFLREAASSFVAKMLPDQVLTSNRHVVLVSDRLSEDAFLGFSGCATATACDPAREIALDDIMRHHFAANTTRTRTQPPQTRQTQQQQQQQQQRRRRSRSPRRRGCSSAAGMTTTCASADAIRVRGVGIDENGGEEEDEEDTDGVNNDVYQSDDSNSDSALAVPHISD